jgi:hypothetical protein
MDVLHGGMLNARVLQFLDGLWSGISLSLVSTFVRFFIILYIIVSGSLFFGFLEMAIQADRAYY